MPRIRPPRRHELETLRSIERDAGRAFAAIGMAEIAADEPPSLIELESRRANRRTWVAIDARDRPVAYWPRSFAGSPPRSRVTRPASRCDAL
jgi:hypothetical protein